MAAFVIRLKRIRRKFLRGAHLGFALFDSRALPRWLASSPTTAICCRLPSLSSFRLGSLRSVSPSLLLIDFLTFCLFDLLSCLFPFPERVRAISTARLTCHHAYTCGLSTS